MFWGADNKDFDKWEGSFYDYFFSYFLNYHKFRDEAQCRNYLNKLRPHAKELWHSYQNDTKSIFPDYSNILTQEAYFLRYCPLYSRSVKKILENLKEFIEIPLNEDSKVCLYSAGPASEIIGILEFAKVEKIKDFKSTSFHLIDRIDWKSTRTMIKAGLKDYLEKEGFQSPEIKERTIDIFDTFENGNTKYDLVIFQNCINEYVSQKSEKEVLRTLSNILDTLSPEGLVIFSERANYQEIEPFFIELSKSKNSDLVEILKRKIPKYRAIDYVPKILLEDFFKDENGLIASRSNSLEFIVFKKI